MDSITSTAYTARFVTISLRRCFMCIDLLVLDAQESQMRKTFVDVRMRNVSHFVTDICLNGENCFRCMHNKVNIHNMNKYTIGVEL